MTNKLTFCFDEEMIETMRFCDWCYNIAKQPEPEYDTSFEMEDEE